MTEETNQDIAQPSVGQILRSTRESKGISIEAVAKLLCISKRQLISLEEDKEDLVCDVYTLGFLKSYALSLGLDGESFVQNFKIKAAYPHVPSLSFPAPLPGRGLPNFRILALSLGILLTLIAGWEWYGYQGAAPFPREEALVVTVAQDPEVEETPVSSLQPSDDTPKLLEDLVAVPEPTPVVLSAREESWIEIKDQTGHIIVSRVMLPGESYEFKKPQNLLLKTGNAKGIDLTSGEKRYSFSADLTKVQSDIPLDSEKWLEQSPKTQ